MWQKFITKCVVFFITKCDSFLIKSNGFHKNATILFQNATLITICVGALDKRKKFGIKFEKTCDKIEKIWNSKCMPIWFSLNY